MQRYEWLPFTWRLALRRYVHALLGTPIPPLLPAGFARRATGHTGVMAQPTLPGANLIGYARGEFGVAETLRAVARALEHRKYPFGIFNLETGKASSDNDHSVDSYISDSPHFTINAFFINADQMPTVRARLGRTLFSRHYNIGFWAWELERFPRDWRAAVNLVDEIWTPSRFVQRAIGSATSKLIVTVPPTISPEPPTGIDRLYFGLRPEDFIFLFNFDFNGFMARKNPHAVVRAFRQAFHDASDPARLILKSSNGNRFPRQLAALGQEIGGDPRIELRDGFLSRHEISGLQNAADCFVSLHRSEGFGLGLAESMFFGKPVIATRYSGNLDFMNDENSLLVDCTMTDVKRGEYPHWRGQRWADPSIGHAATLMRSVYDDRKLARRIGDAASASIHVTHSSAACAAVATAQFQRIEQGLTRPRA